MSKQVKTLLGVAAFAAMIIAALLIYNALYEDHAPDNVVALDSTSAVVVPDAATDIATDIAPEAPAGEPAEVREPIPDFTLLDAAGHQRQISEFFDKPIVLNFWTTWCPACVRETPYFEALYREHGGEVHVIKVNLLDGRRETREGVDQFMYESGYTFPLYFDVDGAAAFGVRGIPVTYFIEVGGYPALMAQGALNARSMEQGLGAILP
ncbi:MAG: TlpA family protein disulfide reductase [Defluviitaleaceae bacterium]|nr:TlpA family protein disulfide reductase [Defluviitaleaceae bacterium]